MQPKLALFAQPCILGKMKGWNYTSSTKNTKFNVAWNQGTNSILYHLIYLAMDSSGVFFHFYSSKVWELRAFVYDVVDANKLWPLVNILRGWMKVITVQFIFQNQYSYSSCCVVHITYQKQFECLLLTL